MIGHTAAVQGARTRGRRVYALFVLYSVAEHIIGRENKSLLTKSIDNIPTPKEIRKVLDD
jgi:hypothetical protein